VDAESLKNHALEAARNVIKAAGCRDNA